MPKLIWIDLETTGLHPKYNRILEVAAFESTTEDPFNVKHLYEAVLRWPPEGDETPGMPPDDKVWRMHERTGLWERCRDVSAKDRWDVERELSNAIGPRPPKYENYPVLAGSSVHFDRAFIREHLPYVDMMFHHRHYDVSSIKMFCRQQGMPRIEPREVHKAADDILESVSHARQCAEWLNSLRGDCGS